MAPPRFVDSDADSDDEQCAPAPSKKPRASRDDVSANATFPERTRNPSSRKPSEKQANIGMIISPPQKENLAAAERRLAEATKEIHRLRKKTNKAAAQVQDTNERPADDDYESEDNDFEDDHNPNFATSIRSLGTLPVAPQRPGAPLRKTNKANATQDTVNLIDSTPPHSPLFRGTNNADKDDNGTDFQSPNAETPQPHSSPRAPHHTDDHGTSSLQQRGHPARDKRPHSPSTSSDPPPKRTKPKVKDPQFREGFVPKSGVKPAVGDYEPIVEALLIRACAEYSARIVALKGFPDPTLQLQSAEECYNNACLSANVRYKLTPRMTKIITKRGSHIRGKIVEGFRPVFAGHYGFKRGTSKAIIAANKLKSEALLRKAAFHYKDPATRSGYAENSIIIDARHSYIFKNKKSLGVTFESYFNPIPAAYLALDFTVLQSLAQEWSTGVHVPASFTEKDMLKAYQTHLTDINEKWIDLNPEVTEKLRRKWYKRATQGLVPAEPEQSTNIDEEDQNALRLELEGRTGDTDTENEDENEDNMAA
ncbi:hypothetical protein DFH07DRAFT_1056698 [Mycena maculata]|uniref:DUF6532 domain-containing protein n=1 Tax=Mycena maculata TaxID=230809 RepID=A0AAD7K0R8_9AGAR|nr:hypothetical protein DFH07DRAFT_1056698 [Mycena maculata]